MDILVVASTLPADADDQVPRFVLDQALSLAAADPDVTVRLLAPHTPRSRARSWPQVEGADGRVTQDRFGYAPRSLETLTARGIMPAIAERRALVGVVPLMFAGEHRALRRAVKARRPDVIYAHWFTPQAIVASSVARRMRVPFGFTTHASDVVVLRRLGPVGNRIVRTVVSRAAFATAVSGQTATKLLDFFTGERRAEVEAELAVAPMGAPAVNKGVPAGDPHTVCVIARLVEKKGIHVLLDAWPSVRANVPDARLLIGGDGPWRSRLEAQARGVDGVEFVGYVTGDAKASLEQRAGIVAVPSIVGRDGDSEGLPVAALEALARGAALVVSDASGAQELLYDSDAGAVVGAGDPEALADALVALMGRDDGARERAREAALHVAESHSWEALAPDMLRRLDAAAGWSA
ncbi:glycosyltransferase family 4 protein [Demequina zhanjiangensis]|uniref:D-inositol 3-phosphate glycosyltransferase n=1 Tax=Demequina zhanjiangensis TaxID=3051659 RepID=A0ABT8G157_9MICO|nr:glycosyltransferase family 4 protein [Demequina sp. SYSU T00b26]MDN4472747.1 glycosyltransferase family 4 protein [Demequina sp. SYSU T00b26]